MCNQLTDVGRVVLGVTGILFKRQGAQSTVASKVTYKRRSGGKSDIWVVSLGPAAKNEQEKIIFFIILILSQQIQHPYSWVSRRKTCNMYLETYLCR